MFHFDKHNPDVLYCDIREFSGVLCDGTAFEVKPDMLADVTALPFPGESFWHVVFDPPHLKSNAGANAWLSKKYGTLPVNWYDFIQQGFAECWRVLKPNGTLVFKWSETKIYASEVIRAIGRDPVYGIKCGKQQGTHWLVFFKRGED